jgi:two-component system, cell cycle sensor histidine kinase and response regulator CckA
MKDEVAGRKELLAELEDLRCRVAELESTRVRLRDAECALTESEEKYRTLVTNANLGIFMTSPDGLFLQANPAMARMAGYASVDELMTVTADRLYVERSDRQRVLEKLTGKGAARNYEIRAAKRDGTVFWASLNAVLHKDATGTPVWILGIVEDITERKQAEERLQESEQRFRALSEATFEAIFLSERGICIGQNLTAEEMFGYSTEEAVGRVGTEWIAPEYRELVLNHMLSGYKGAYEAVALRKDGTTFPCEIQGKMIDYGARRIRVTALRDITSRKGAEQGWVESEERFRTAFHTSPDSINIHRLSDGVYIDVNEGFTSLTGYSREDVIDKSSWDVGIWNDTEDRKLMLACLKRDGFVRNLMAKFRLKDGSVRTGLMSARIIMLKGEPHLLSVTRDIQDWIAAQEALRKTEAKYRKLVESTDGGFVEMETSGKVIQANDPYARMAGAFRAEEIIGYSVLDWTAPECLIENEAAIRLCAEQGHISNFETTYLRADGSRVRILINATAEETPEGITIATLCRDITERKQAEEAMRQSEQKYRELVQNANSIILRWNRKGEITFLNEFGQHFFGYSEEEIMGQHVVGTIVPDTESGGRDLRPLMEQICANPRAFEHNINENMLKDGSRVWIAWTNKAVFDEESQLVEIFSVGTDITERKRTEGAIRNIVAGVSSEIGLKFFDSITVHFSSTLGADCTLIGERIEKEGAEFIRTLSFCLDGQVSDNIEYPLKGSPCEIVLRKGLCSYPREVQRLFPHDNELVKLGAEGYVGVELSDSSGMSLGVMAALYRSPIKDVEFAESILQIFAARAAAEIDRKRVEKERLRLATAIEQAGESILITDPSGRILYANPAFAETTGYSVHEVLGETAAILNSGKQDVAFYENMWSTIKGGHVWRGRFVNKKKNGSLYDETATISPIRDEAGRVLNYVMVGRDVTSEMMLQKQLLHAQKMEAIGTLAGGIAHDFNNLLQAIFGYADLLLMRNKADDPDRQKIEIIHHAAQDGAELVSRILTFSRKAEAKTRPLDLNEEIRRAERLLRRTVPKMIEIKLGLADGLRIIDADPAQVEQILLNLAVNAQHAMPDGGQLLVETSNVSLGDEFLRTHLDAKAGKYVLLTVSDTGVGIAPDVQDRIFDPFFTTKTNGEGTGLGLAMVHGIVHQHGGHIRCYSEPGIGTSFNIYFPVSTTERLLEVAETREMPAFGSENILLVDDDDRVREMAREMIQERGYQVLMARSGEQALEIYAAHRDDISLILLDLNMPGMGGKKCLEELLRIDPNVKVLVASGYSSGGLNEGEKGLRANGFISKPYDAKDLLGAMRKILDHGHR